MADKDGVELYEGVEEEVADLEGLALADAVDVLVTVAVALLELVTVTDALLEIEGVKLTVGV